MKNPQSKIILVLLASAILACSTKTGSEETQAITSNELENTTVNSVKESSTPITFKDESTTAIFNTYIELKDALVKTDADEASAEAKNLETLVSGEEYTAIKVEASKIAESTDPSTQREAFDELSEQMIILAKSSELTSGNLFLQHCPMANGNKGANWLSLSEEIRNPYFGDRMLKCGSVTEKI